jgi:UV DNA damage endonuclease
LCCLFREQPIKFRRKTAKSLQGVPRSEQLSILAGLCLANAQALLEALHYCRDQRIGDFRINSQVLPLYTHPQLGYRIGDLPGHGQIIDTFDICRNFCARHGLRTTLHPDQFILLSSPSEDVTRRSIAELDYQAEVSDMVGADVINIHGGGAYGDKGQALDRLKRRLGRLRSRVRKRLTLENDDKIYSPRDLLPMCRSEGVPFVYDAHHHRCLADALEAAEVTAMALRTWDREPLFHISSPRGGWQGGSPRSHDEFVDPSDIPDAWLSLDQDLTVEVEAKAKELAVNRLRKDLADRVVLFPED